MVQLWGMHFRAKLILTLAIFFLTIFLIMSTGQIFSDPSEKVTFISGEFIFMLSYWSWMINLFPEKCYSTLFSLLYHYRSFVTREFSFVTCEYCHEVCKTITSFINRVVLWKVKETTNLGVRAAFTIIKRW